MRVLETTRDFLDRTELLYGDRVGVVDESPYRVIPVCPSEYRPG